MLKRVTDASDYEVFFPAANPNVNHNWKKNKFTLDIDLITFRLLHPLTEYDIIKIDFDVSMA